MNRFTPEQFYCKQNRPSESWIRLTANRFLLIHNLNDKPTRQRRCTVYTEEVIITRRIVEEDANESIRHRVQQLEL